MGQSDNDALVMETVRRRTGNDAVGENTRFAEDLHMGEIARRLLFSFMMETFTARGVNLPAKGCFVSSFMPCASTSPRIPGGFARSSNRPGSGATSARSKANGCSECRAASRKITKRRSI